MNLKGLSLTNLFLMKKWLEDINVTSVQNERKIVDTLFDVDKELWKRLICEDTPWDNRKKYFKDPIKNTNSEG